MLLDQINRRLAEFKANLPTKKVRAMPSSATREAPAEGTTKTIGIQVDAETYAKLQAFMHREKLTSMKKAALLAIRRTVDR